MAGGDDKQYAQPPVRTTVFSVFFTPIDLDLAVITELRNKWVEAYPGFTQAAPKQRRSKLLQPTDILLSKTWPMPAAQMADSSLSRTLSFQSDQFSLTWKFDSDEGGSRYPGYAALVAELIDRFAEFVAVVDSSSDSTVTVEGCRCFYTNTLEGVGGPRWLAWLLAGQDSTDYPLDDALHFGFRVYCEDEVEGIKRGVSTQMDAGRRYPSSEVDISATAVPAEGADGLPTDATERARRLMDAAHDLENQTFRSSFSETMKKQWEAKS